MRKLATLAAIAALAGAMVLASSLASAIPSEHLNWGHELAASETACPAGEPVINVVQKVINGIDWGDGGNYWAYDDYVTQIAVVQTAPNTFCATVKYQGNFESVAGTSPGNSGVIEDGVVGTFHGGYTVTLTSATLKASPEFRTKGSIGTIDYGCDASTGICTDSFNWVATYFDAYAIAYEWWGWIYHGGNNGSWVNAVTGNEGDITGN